MACRFTSIVLFVGLASTSLVPAKGGAPTACTTNVSVTPTLRSEGLTELTGDITLTCTGGTPTPSAQNIPSADLAVFLNTSVTSLVITAPDSKTASEALLLVDEPLSGLPGSPQQQTICGSTTGCTVKGTATGGMAGPEPFDGTAARPNIFLGVVQGNEVTFKGVPVEAGPRVYRITNIRVNASALGSGTGATPVVVSIAVSGATSLPISNPTATVGFVQRALQFSLRDGADTAALANSGFALAAGTGPASNSPPSAHLRFSENFGTSFKTRTTAAFTNSGASPTPLLQNIPGTIYNSESGFMTSTQDGTAGLASFGTRFKAVFQNIPSGVNVYVGITSTTATGRVARLTGSETAKFAAVVATDTFASLGAVLIPIVNGEGTAVWEVLQTNPNSMESFDIPVWFAASSTGAGTGKVSGSLAPNASQGAFTASAGAAAQSSLPIPRFADTSGPVNLVQVTPVTLTSLPAALAFQYTTGSAVPLPQGVGLSVSGINSSLSFTAAASSSGSWLSVSPLVGSVPGNLSVAVTPGSLPPATYLGSVMVTSTQASNSPLIIPVTLTVSVIPVLPTVADGGVTNAASFAKDANGRGSAVAPGSLVTIFGTFPGAIQATASAVPFLNSLGGVSVTFGGFPAPMRDVSPSSAFPFLNAQLPFEVLSAGQTSGNVNVVVTVNGTASAPRSVPVTRAAPGVFTIPPGAGYAILVNLTDFKVAAPASANLGVPTRPIKRGEEGFIYVTGLGAMTPPIQDGSNDNVTLHTANSMPIVWIGGVNTGVMAPVSFAGQAPPYPGVNQINITIPNNAPTGDSVALQIQTVDGAVISPPNVATVAIQ